MTQTIECIETSESAEDVRERQPGRRVAIFGMASALIAGLSALGSTKAYADCQGSPCCGLALCKQCLYQVNKNRFTCPSGYNRTYWTCVSSGITWYCGECTTGSDCYHGSYNCSIWYR